MLGAHESTEDEELHEIITKRKFKADTNSKNLLFEKTLRNRK